MWGQKKRKVGRAHPVPYLYQTSLRVHDTRAKGAEMQQTASLTPNSFTAFKFSPFPKIELLQHPMPNTHSELQPCHSLQRCRQVL